MLPINVPVVKDQLKAAACGCKCDEDKKSKCLENNKKDTDNKFQFTSMPSCSCVCPKNIAAICADKTKKAKSK